MWKHPWCFSKTLGTLPQSNRTHRMKNQLWDMLSSKQGSYTTVASTPCIQESGPPGSVLEWARACDTSNRRSPKTWQGSRWCSSLLLQSSSVRIFRPETQKPREVTWSCEYGKTRRRVCLASLLQHLQGHLKSIAGFTRLEDVWTKQVYVNGKEMADCANLSSVVCIASHLSHLYVDTAFSSQICRLPRFPRCLPLLHSSH